MLWLYGQNPAKLNGKFSVGYQVVFWSPDAWDQDAIKLATGAFRAVVDVVGPGRGPAALWAEAECLIRCG